MNFVVFREIAFNRILKMSASKKRGLAPSAVPVPFFSNCRNAIVVGYGSTDFNLQLNLCRTAFDPSDDRNVKFIENDKRSNSPT